MSEKSPKNIKNTCKTNIYKFRANSKKAHQVNPSPFKSAQVPWTYFLMDMNTICIFFKEDFVNISTFVWAPVSHLWTLSVCQRFEKLFEKINILTQRYYTFISKLWRNFLFIKVGFIFEEEKLFRSLFQIEMNYENNELTIGYFGNHTKEWPSHWNGLTIDYYG